MYERSFAAHPVLTVLATAALMGLVGWWELSVGKSRGGAYLTWGVTGISLIGFLILRFLG